MSPEEFDIRYTKILDIVYLKKWLADPAVACWFPMQTPEEMELAVSCWMSFARYHASLTAIIDQKPCGIATLFLPPYKKIAHHCLFKICVAPEHQGKGIGRSLIRNIKHLARSQFHFESIYAEVFDENPLIPLLKKFDFHEFVRQEGYVKQGGKYSSRVFLETDLTKADP